MTQSIVFDVTDPAHTVVGTENRTLFFQDVVAPLVIGSVFGGIAAGIAKAADAPSGNNPTPERRRLEAVSNQRAVSESNVVAGLLPNDLNSSAADNSSNAPFLIIALLIVVAFLFWR